MNPYQNPASSQSRFPFAGFSRQEPPQAPLFYSAAEGYPQDDEGHEYQREVADSYALQRSRQQFGPSNLTESSEMDDDGLEELEETQKGQNHDRDESLPRGRLGAPYSPSSRAESRASDMSGKGKGRLVDVNLNSTIDEEPPESLANLSPSIDPDEPPAPIRTFGIDTKHGAMSSYMPAETDEETRRLHRPMSPDRESVPPTVVLPAQEPPKHDAFWANIFQIAECTMFAVFILMWFQSSAPKNSLGDTIYTALRGSTSMLVWDTLIAVVVSLVWLTLLRNHVKPLVYLLLIAVPIVLFSFSLYPFISSFQGRWDGTSLQDRALRWASFVPAILGFFWTWSVIKSRHSIHSSIQVLEFSTKILAASPYLIVLGFSALAVVVTFSWTWILMFERIFLSGHFAGAKKWVINANSWWLGAFFILQYLWTLGVIAGLQRATTAAVVSQWYFHRLAVPQPTSQEVVQASFLHATGALFGTTCLSTFLSLLVRLPLIILPGRLSGLLNMAAYWIMPSSLATLTNPLTLTYAAIHSKPLGIAARGLNQLNFVSVTNPSNTLGPRNFNPAQSGSALMPYRLAKLLLSATRWIMSFGLGFGGWVRAAHSIQIQGAASGLRGSLYAYIVGMIAGTIGFAVLGCIENIVGGVIDASMICWASETAGGRGEARFCREAGELFGNEGRLNLDQRRNNMV